MDEVGVNGDLAFFLTTMQAAIEADRASCVAHGWAFKERTPGRHAMGDVISSVCRIDRPDDARRFYLGYVAWLRALPPAERSEDDTPEQVAQANIGWCFGEGMDADRRAMWAQTTGASHPVFGITVPTPEAAFAAGLAAGEVLHRPRKRT